MINFNLQNLTLQKWVTKEAVVEVEASAAEAEAAEASATEAEAEIEVDSVVEVEEPQEVVHEVAEEEPEVEEEELVPVPRSLSNLTSDSKVSMSYVERTTLSLPRISTQESLFITKNV